MNKDLGALSGSRASTEPSSTVSALTGFDPARVANIANRLSSLERRAMLHREGGSESCMSWDTAKALYEKGLTERNARFLRLTRLGQHVRATLQVGAL